MNPIQVTNLSVKKGDFELNIPSWSLEAGQIVGLVGRNGAGKSTFLHSLYALQKMNSGTVSILGKDPLKDLVDVRQEVGFVSPLVAYPGISVANAFSLLSKVYVRWDSAYADQLCARFNIDQKKEIQKLSLGQLSAFRLVSALAYRPKVLLLDEPAANLDLIGKQDTYATLFELLEAHEETSVIISSHELHDIERVADRIVVLREGQIIQDASCEMLIDSEYSLAELFIKWSSAA